MTIHIVNSVELMLGWNTMSSVAAGAGSSVSSKMGCGAGNSSVPSM